MGEFKKFSVDFLKFVVVNKKKKNEFYEYFPEYSITEPVILNHLNHFKSLPLLTYYPGELEIIANDEKIKISEDIGEKEIQCYIIASESDNLSFHNLSDINLYIYLPTKNDSYALKRSNFIKKLIEKGYKTEEIAALMKMSEDYIKKLYQLNLLLIPEFKKELEFGIISLSLAFQIMNLSPKEQKKFLIQRKKYAEKIKELTQKMNSLNYNKINTD